GKLGMSPQSVRKPRKLDPPPAKLLFQPPLSVRHERLPQLPGMQWIGRIKLPDSGRLKAFADRFEKLSAVLLDERLEKRHPQHLPFPLEDAGGEKFVAVVAERVAVKKGPPAVGLHQNLNGCFLLGLAAENLGDDAFHLSAIAFIEQPGAPFGERVAA